MQPKYLILPIFLALLFSIVEAQPFTGQAVFMQDCTAPSYIADGAEPTIHGKNVVFQKRVNENITTLHLYNLEDNTISDVTQPVPLTKDLEPQIYGNEILFLREVTTIYGIITEKAMIYSLGADNTFNTADDSAFITLLSKLFSQGGVGQLYINQQLVTVGADNGYWCNTEISGSANYCLNAAVQLSPIGATSRNPKLNLKGTGNFNRQVFMWQEQPFGTILRTTHYKITNVGEGVLPMTPSFSTTSDLYNGGLFMLTTSAGLVQPENIIMGLLPQSRPPVTALRNYTENNRDYSSSGAEIAHTPTNGKTYVAWKKYHRTSNRPSVIVSDLNDVKNQVEIPYKRLIRSFAIDKNIVIFDAGSKLYKTTCSLA